MLHTELCYCSHRETQGGLEASLEEASSWLSLPGRGWQEGSSSLKGELGEVGDLGRRAVQVDGCSGLGGIAVG